MLGKGAERVKAKKQVFLVLPSFETDIKGLEHTASANAPSARFKTLSSWGLSCKKICK